MTTIVEGSPTEAASFSIAVTVAAILLRAVPPTSGMSNGG
jgi:hypothetical protein